MTTMLQTKSAQSRGSFHFQPRNVEMKACEVRHEKIMILIIIGIFISIHICIQWALDIESRQAMYTFIVLGIFCPMVFWYLWFGVYLATLWADRLRQFVFRVFFIASLSPSYYLTMWMTYLFGAFGGTLTVMVLGMAIFLLYTSINQGVNNFVSLRSFTPDVRSLAKR